MVAVCIYGILRLRRRMRSDSAQDDRRKIHIHKKRFISAKEKRPRLTITAFSVSARRLLRCRFLAWIVHSRCGLDGQRLRREERRLINEVKVLGYVVGCGVMSGWLRRIEAMF